MTVQKLFPIALIGLFAIGCLEESDLESPITEIISPHYGDTLYIDEGLRLVATLQDNGALNQYRLTLDGIDELNGPIADSAISRIFIDDLAEDEFYIERVFDIPDTLMNGHYHLSMSALDLAGNESEADSIEFFFRNRNDTVQPTFIDTVLFDTINEERGGLLINVDMIDDELVFCRLSVMHEDGVTVIGEKQWSDVHLPWLTFWEWYPYLETWPEGNFITNILVIDKYGFKEYSDTVYFEK